MKKTFLAITALAAMLFAGCTSSDELTTLESIKTAENTPTPVQFGTYMGKTGITRGDYASVYEGVITDTQLKDNTDAGTYGFGVFGYLTNSSYASTSKPDFMYNEHVYWNSTSWIYAPIKYWPNGKDAKNYGGSDPSDTATEGATQYLSFFAYAPYANTIFFNSKTWTLDAVTGEFKNSTDNYSSQSGAYGITKVTTNDAAGDPKITYVLNSLHFVDLLWGLRGASSYEETDNSTSDGTVGTTYNTDLTKETTSETVDFVFKHALAKFAGESGLKVVLDIDTNGDGETGSVPTSSTWYDWDGKTNVTISNITIQNKENQVITNGLFNLANGTWTKPDGTAIAVGTASAGAYVNYNIGSSDMNTAIYAADPSGSPLASTPIFTPGSPGTWSITGVPTNTAANVYKSGSGIPFYLIPGAEQTLTVSVTYTVKTYDPKLNAGYSFVTQTITNDVKITPLVNKFYTLVLHLGLTSVKFSATVNSWDDVNGNSAQEIWLPSNVVE